MIEKFSNLKEFQKYKKIKPKNIREIYTLMDYVSLKIDQSVYNNCFYAQNIN